MVAKRKQFAVIGLGRFGGSVCEELVKQGNEVLGIDKDEHRVNEYSNIATHTLVADSTDEATLRSLGIGNFETVFVSIGDDIQASILTTLLLKELGIKNICVKAKNIYHHKVLEKIGADDIVHPEKDMGKRVAQKYSDKNVIDFIELSDDYSIMELVATSKLDGKTLVELDIRARYGITILAIKKAEEINVSPEPGYRITKGELLIVIGHNREIKKFEEKAM
ncbi:potassium transporter Trk [Salipaludibacillus neizhouensis]|uniref:Potassium transporter Trk n=1 Tax=Salipaludibacillus neizhouensis TaxID=885475 RepID=A0A3A9KM11_9BACI|nr:TrkA family potassium uptake protein [Salipaludibacillus neizhouensis]RKL65786.1 potassium transporter Trk [Salipaludibacillus neizhouensis]